VARRLAERLAQLDARVRAGDEGAWPEYIAAASGLAALLPHVAPERRDALLTTAEMAARLGVAPKTLLRHRAAGAIQPAVVRGKLIRWRGTEALR
jgi:hypothetical protein